MKDTYLQIPARRETPQTSIYTKIFAQDTENLCDRDVVILIPGGPGNDHTMYDTPEHSIAKTFLTAVNVVLFDPRGCGRNEPSPVEACSLDHYIDDIEAIRSALNIPPEKLIIFGQSYGSFAATGYAARYPNNLKKLLLIGGVVNSEFMTEAKQDLEKIGTPEQKRFAEKLWHGSFDGSQDEVAGYYRVMSPLYSYSFIAQDDAPLEIPCNIDILNYGWGHFLKHFDFRPELKNIKCSTLILWGENEWIMNGNQVQQLHLGIKNSTLMVYSQCGHMLWLDQWERFTEDALHFLIIPNTHKKATN